MATSETYTDVNVNVDVSIPDENNLEREMEEALFQIHANLQTASSTSTSTSKLRIQSMRQSYSYPLLEQFYEEQMIPHFPLEDERDSLEDWVLCLDPTKLKEDDKGPLMDVLLLLCDIHDKGVDHGDVDTDANLNDNGSESCKTKSLILAGVAFEYYQQAEIGLVSYITVHRAYRRKGIMTHLHPLAISALHRMYAEVNIHNRQRNEGIRAIFAETNTIHADEVKQGVVTEQDIRTRHKALYKLGYRMVEFPYSQPPLGVDEEAFEDVMLLVYQGRLHSQEHPRNIGEGSGAASGAGDHNSRKLWFNGRIPSVLPHAFVVDFYMSVFGYLQAQGGDNDEKQKESLSSLLLSSSSFPFRHHRTFQLSKWFTQEHTYANIKNDLPWDDVTDNYQQAFENSSKDEDANANKNKNTSVLNEGGNALDSANSQTNANDVDSGDEDDAEPTPTSAPAQVVAVVGAGAAGLSAAIKIAKDAASPVIVKLIEANDFVGGRIRTIITNVNHDHDCPEVQNEPEQQQHQHQQQDEHMSKDLIEIGKRFAPWPVPIGAEFVHGVGSVVNDIIEEQGWEVEETFNFCSSEEYPTDNSFLVRDATNSLSDRQIDSDSDALVKIFGDGQFWDLKHSHNSDSYADDDACNSAGNSRYGKLIQEANRVWDEIYSVGDDFCSDHERGLLIPPSDMVLSNFIDKKMNKFPKEDIDDVKLMLDAIYAKTAGSTVDDYGVNEACREELAWDYTESNFRTKKCFADIIGNFLHEIKTINRLYEMGTCKGRIELIRSTPIVRIGKVHERANISKVMLIDRNGGQFICDKVVVAVPLGVLKAGTIQFCDEFSLPPEKKLAIEKINFFSGMKAHMLLRKGIDIDSSKMLENTDLFFCPGEVFVQVWVRRNKESIFLTGFVVANGRDKLLSEMENNRKTSKEIFMNQLQKMLFCETTGEDSFTECPATCTAFELHDWSEDEFTRGIYSSPSIGAGWKCNSIHCDRSLLKTSRNDIKSPIGNVVFFAGEHANVKTCATVQAAIESGLVAASDVLGSLAQ